MPTLHLVASQKDASRQQPKHTLFSAFIPCSGVHRHRPISFISYISSLISSLLLIENEAMLNGGKKYGGSYGLRCRLTNGGGIAKLDEELYSVDQYLFMAGRRFLGGKLLNYRHF